MESGNPACAHAEPPLVPQGDDKPEEEQQRNQRQDAADGSPEGSAPHCHALNFGSAADTTWTWAASRHPLQRGNWPVERLIANQVPLH